MILAQLGNLMPNDSSSVCCDFLCNFAVADGLSSICFITVSNITNRAVFAGEIEAE